MSRNVIVVENLGKRYRLHHQERERYSTLRDTLARRAKSLFRDPRAALRTGQTDEDFWALKDVSFEIKEGEVVGIIGRNGAGKSTLLKILSRITEPTTGRVGIRGRVASLLEVGTGFHPELTGRENIFLNGAVLGMSREEIKRKFDEIVAFAEIEKFLDTPVKRYSSGMYVRLAFAVAAHLEPEILIVDEVLAVGDAEFQRKCLGKMESVATREGRTVLFVSHNLIAVQRLCQSGLLLSSGNLALQGGTTQCIEQYISSSFGDSEESGFVDLQQVPHYSLEDFRFLTISVVDAKGVPLTYIPVAEDFQVQVEFELDRHYRDLFIGVGLHTHDDFPIFATHSNDFADSYSLPPGRYITRAKISPNYLRQGRYKIEIGALSSGHVLAHVPSAMQIASEPLLTNELAGVDNRRGALFIPLRWSSPIKVESGKVADGEKTLEVFSA